ncbi:MAG: trigger factor [Thermoguttaceae bacterium]|nr:trigger factor [Thermoguttaceae bacterium]
MATEFDAAPENEEIQKMNLKVDVEEKSSCERHVKIEISREDVDRYFDREYDDLQENAAIPGFRAGKAPRKLIEKRFRNEVKERVKAALLQDALVQASEDQSMTPISEPNFDVAAVVVPEEGPFIFEYDVEVRPTFDIPNWKGLKLEKPVREFSSEDVDAAIKRIQTNYGSLEDKGAPAETGDYIVSKLTFELDGKVLSQAAAETIRIRPTLTFHDCSISDFDKLMAGAQPGDVRKTNLTLSQDAVDENLRGKEINATFEIAAVKKLIVPEVDEDFIQQFGGFENVGDFRDMVLETLERQLEHEQQSRARRQIASQLTVDANWELPPRLLRSQADRELQRAVLELRRSGFSDQQIIREMNLIRQNSAAVTAQALKEHFILEAIAESENIQAEQNDYEAEILLIAAQAGESPRRVRAQIEKNGSEDALRNQIIERKVINMIMESAEFVEVPYVMEELNEEAVDRAAGAPEQSEIPEVTEEEAKEAARAAAQAKA